MKSLTLLLAGALLVASAAQAADQKKVELLNASYDVARELFTQINPAFQAQWKAKTGQDVEIRQSHGGSSKQAVFDTGGRGATTTFVERQIGDVLVTFITIEQRFGGWENVTRVHFSNGGVLDQLIASNNK